MASDVTEPIVQAQGRRKAGMSPRMSDFASPRFRVDRRLFLSGLLAGGSTLALASVAQARGDPGPCRVAEGPLRDILPQLTGIVRDPEMSRFLFGLDPDMRELAALPTPVNPPFQRVTPTHDERRAIIRTIDEIVTELLPEQPPGQSLTHDDIRRAKKEARRRVLGFLEASRAELDQLIDTMIPLNLASLPVTRAVGNSFILVDVSGPNLLFTSPVFVSEDDKLVKKALLLGAMILAIIGFVLALLSIKVPNVNADKIQPAVTRLLQDPRVSTAFNTMIEIVKREGATIGQKIAAVFAYLRTLWEVSGLKTILKDVFAEFSFFDLLVTIASIVALLFSGGASAIARGALAAAALALALIKGAQEYEKVQQTTT